MRKHLFPFQKILLFLFYLESMVIMEQKHKNYFWAIVTIVFIVSYTYQGARIYTPLFFLIAIVDYFDQDILQMILVLITGILVVYIKFYHIPIVGKGSSNPGYRYYNQNGIQIAIFYPTNSKGDKVRWVPSDRYDAVFYDIMFVDPQKKRIPFAFFNFIVSFAKKVYMPVLGNAKFNIQEDSKKSSQKLIIFSHGLGSNMNNCSSLCSWFATHGYIVICPQHHNDRVRIDFLHIPLTEEEKIEQYLYEIRNQDLQIRVQETINLYDEITKNKLLEKIFPEVSQFPIKEIYLGGHSYGGATAIETLSRLKENQASVRLIKGIICLDAWFFPLSASTYKTLTNQNMLFINTETFFIKVPKLYRMEDKMGRIYQKNKETLKAFMIKKTEHLAPVDVNFVFGNLIQISDKNKLNFLSPKILQLHENIISLFLEGLSNDQIFETSNKFADQLGLAKHGIEVVKEYRYSRQK